MKNFAVFGNPADHSLSPLLHSLLAQRAGIQVSYSKRTIELADFEKAVGDFFYQERGCGLNITIPFKERAFKLCDRTTKRANHAQAVNTIWQQQGRLYGDNTDGTGIITDLKNRLQWKIKNKHLLILGAGGSVRGIIDSLLQAQPNKCTIANRTVERARQLVNDCAARHTRVTIQTCGFEQLAESYDYIINATSISLGSQDIPFPPSIIKSAIACYDLGYSANEDTLFCQWAQKNGCQSVSDGLGMLVEQGAESFRIWHGVIPDTSGIIETLRAPPFQ